ncbi:IPT/TIG domain-containing protein [Paractinoplanes lichenicola]|uniref:IPT/TIG domain-containing protein n=1 Tax=Paractinoplanes lichenicola TaxID=2802976 RepID=A0ABS1VI15_9ACTN|nr:IPT/TIG domain-containing protein [Actinoplanes lichenicola]MBL7254313.1 IPT/TIG domain-containing protein [Actinoplanes lichenicola]
MRKSTTTARQRMVRAGLATGASSALVVALGMTPAYAAVGTLTLSSVFGPTGGGNTVTATITTNPTSPNPTQFTTATNAQFVAAATTSTQCPAIYTAPGTNQGATVRYLTPQKIAVTVPTGVVLASGATATNYKLCTYNGTTTGTGGSAVVAQGNYTVGTKPVITSISPGGGPSLGGTTVTVKGDNFTSTNLSATIGGQALSDIKYIDAQTFTATTPAMKAGGPMLLTVTTPGGTANTLGATTTKANLFTYANGIVVSPNTAPNNVNTPVDLDISGVGFMSIDFPNTSGFTPNATGGHVYLVRGSYDPSGASSKTLGQTDECTNVIVIADNELLCSLGLTIAGPNSKVTNAGATTSGSAALTGTGFAATDAGRAITGPGIPAGTYIASYTSATAVTLSQNATATGSSLSITVGGPRTAAVNTTSGSTAVTGAAGTFITTQDVGRYISGPGIAPGTTLTAVANDGAATLSQAATATATGASLTIVTQGPVPVDSYTVTVVSNGLNDVQPAGTNADANYTKSVVSSGSTFTVSDF